MAKKRIKDLQQFLSKIRNDTEGLEAKDFETWIKNSDIQVQTAGMDNIKHKCIQAVHTELQTETMLYACILAKWSCFCAAIAAIVACISVILTLCQLNAH